MPGGEIMALFQQAPLLFNFDIDNSRLFRFLLRRSCHTHAARSNSLSLRSGGLVANHRSSVHATREPKTRKV